MEQFFDVDFSFCFLLKYMSSFSLEQSSGCSCRQAFIHYCGLHQLMKSTVVDESLSTTTTIVMFQRETTSVLEHFLKSDKTCSASYAL